MLPFQRNSITIHSIVWGHFRFNLYSFRTYIKSDNPLNSGTQTHAHTHTPNVWNWKRIRLTINRNDLQSFSNSNKRLRMYRFIRYNKMFQFSKRLINCGCDSMDFLTDKESDKMQIHLKNAHRQTIR